LNGDQNINEYYLQDQKVPSIAGRFNIYEMVYLYYTDYTNSSPAVQNVVYKHIPTYQYTLKKHIDREFVVFPNPFENTIYIQLLQDMTSLDFNEVVVYSILGETVFLKTLDSNYGKSVIRIDLPQLKKGTYFILLKGSSITEKFQVIKG